MKYDKKQCICTFIRPKIPQASMSYQYEIYINQKSGYYLPIKTALQAFLAMLWSEDLVWRQAIYITCELGF